MSNAHQFTDNNSKNIIISFGSNAGLVGKVPIFEFKRSLSEMDLDFNILYLKDVKRNWYLSKLENVGNNITHTKAFLKKIIDKHENVITIGASSGGFASILFGSLFEVNCAIAFNPQTDLEYAKLACDNDRLKNFAPCDEKLSNLIAYKKYNSLKDVVKENSKTQYFLSYKTNDDPLHNKQHFDHIKTDNVNHFPYQADVAIKNGELEKLLSSFISK